MKDIFIEADLSKLRKSSIQGLISILNELHENLVIKSEILLPLSVLCSVEIFKHIQEKMNDSESVDDFFNRI